MAARRRRVEWTRRAVDALEEALAFVATDSPPAAERLLDRLLRAAASLSELTERGRRLPELNDPNVREPIIPPYRLIYEYDAESVRILALLHDAQDFRLRLRDGRET